MNAATSIPVTAARKRDGLARIAQEASAAATNAQPIEGASAYRSERFAAKIVRAMNPIAQSAPNTIARRSNHTSGKHGRDTKVTTSPASALKRPARTAYSAALWKKSLKPDTTG